MRIMIKGGVWKNTEVRCCSTAPRPILLAHHIRRLQPTFQVYLRLYTPPAILDLFAPYNGRLLRPRLAYAV